MTATEYGLIAIAYVLGFCTCFIISSWLLGRVKKDPFQSRSNEAEKLAKRRCEKYHETHILFWEAVAGYVITAIVAAVFVAGLFQIAKVVILSLK